MLIPEMTKLVNRTSKRLIVRFDGQDFRLEPGENMVPKVLVPYAKSQCVLMGSEDEVDPSDFVSLVGVPGKDDVDPIEQNEDEPTRVQLSKIVGENVKIVRRGKKKPSAFDAHVPSPGGDNIGVLSRA